MRCGLGRRRRRHLRGGLGAAQGVELVGRDDQDRCFGAPDRADDTVDDPTVRDQSSSPSTTTSTTTPPPAQGNLFTESFGSLATWSFAHWRYEIPGNADAASSARWRRTAHDRRRGPELR